MKQPFPRTAALALVAALAALPVRAQPGRGPSRVVTDPVIEKEVSFEESFVGTVMPTRTSKLGSAASGRVEAFAEDVKEGQRIEKGKPIARLRTRIIEAELAAAKATRDARNAGLQTLLKALPEQIKQAEERLKSARLLRDFYANVRRRMETASTAVSREELERAQQEHLRADAAFREAEAALRLEFEPRKEKEDQARAMLAQAEAEVNRLTEQLERHTVRAPFNCYLLHNRAEVGQWVLQGELVAEVVELDEVDVITQVLEDVVQHIRLGQEVEVKVPSLPGRAFIGKVSAIIPVGNERARTFPVKVRVKNEPVGKSMLLKAGMFARVTFLKDQKRKVLLVHKDALNLEGGKPAVLVVEKSPRGASGLTVRRVEVEIGMSHNEFIEVRGKLEPGQQLVVEGNERLRPGQSVVPISRNR
jgi:HlyD family secretion protein